MDSKSEINSEREIHAWVFNGKSLNTRSLKLGELLFSVKNQHFTAILERVELCASGSHPIRRSTHCTNQVQELWCHKFRSSRILIQRYKARTAAAVKIPEFQPSETLPGMSHRDSSRHESLGCCPTWFFRTLPGMFIGDAAPACFPFTWHR
ncbi:uncharacterized protein LOC133732807 isoform X4 [Rosa rugosa]|uniref:uncharacterized protein LOC133732807 isoform X4 n=1 Tax=Rosa rugosa TaxID=74645 RepID=UPI002B4007F2|nr:uncharacterized protein LOC133732807 isoform X4 [Rosa rugosa]